MNQQNPALRDRWHVNANMFDCELPLWLRTGKKSLWFLKVLERLRFFKEVLCLRNVAGLFSLNKKLRR